MVFIRDPLGIVCLMVIYGAVIYADYVVIRWIILTTMPLSIWAPFHVVLFNTIVFLVVMSHSKAIFSDPGLVPLNANRLDFSEVDSDNGHSGEWTFCNLCESYRPPYAHHCSICQRCIRRVDHHCSCINNCVGEFNQKYFLLFLFYVGILSLYSVALVLFAWLSPCTECTQLVIETQWLHTIILISESALFGLFVTVIMLDQLTVILYDETVFKIPYRPKRSKYQLFAKVFGRGHPMLWLLPWGSLNLDTPLFSHEV